MPERTSTLLTACFVLLGLCAPVPAQDEGAAATPQTDGAALSESETRRVRELVARLDSDGFEEREEAMRELEALGPKIAPLIGSLLDEASVEVRLRLRELLDRLPGGLSEAPIRFEPTLITLDVEAQPARDVFRLLERRAGVEIKTIGAFDSERPLTLHCAGEPLFSVIDRIGEALAAVWTRDYRTGSFRFMNGQLGDGRFRIYSGPTRFDLTRISRNATLTFGAEKSERCYLQGQFDVEPGCGVIGVWMPPRIDEIKDAAGGSLVEDQVVATPNLQLAAGRTTFPFSIGFKAPPRTADKIAHLAGKMVVIVPKRYRRVTLAVGSNAETPSEATSGGLTARLLPSPRSREGRVIRLELTRKPLRATPEGRTEIRDDIFELTTEDGRTISPAGPPARQPGGDRGREIFTVTVPPKETVIAVTVRSLAAFAEIEIPFAFDDIPLP